MSDQERADQAIAEIRMSRVEQLLADRGPIHRDLVKACPHGYELHPDVPFYVPKGSIPDA